MVGLWAQAVEADLASSAEHIFISGGAGAWRLAGAALGCDGQAMEEAGPHPRAGRAFCLDMRPKQKRQAQISTCHRVGIAASPFLALRTLRSAWRTGAHVYARTMQGRGCVADWTHAAAAADLLA